MSNITVKMIPSLFFLANGWIWGILLMVVLGSDSIGAEFPLKG